MIRWKRRHEARLTTSCIDRPYAAKGNKEINERVQELASDRGVLMAQIALAWLLHKDWVDAPIVGTTSVEHL